MLSGVTIGQYYPADSVIHKLDARLKIVLTLIMMVSIFLCKSYIALGVCFVCTVIVVLLSKISLKAIFKGVKPILIIILITALLNLFYGTGEPIYQLWVFKITEAGIHNAVFMVFRVFLLVLLGLMLTYTTTPTRLTDAIESLLKPLHTVFKLDVHSFAMTMTIALRFIPTLVEEVDKIMSAQKSRGADMESGGIVKRVKALIPVIVPLFVSSFRRAGELAYAMDCRCYRGGDGRTKMNAMHLAGRDWAAMVIAALYIAAIILMRIFLTKVI